MAVAWVLSSTAQYFKVCFLLAHACCALIECWLSVTEYYFHWMKLCHLIAAAIILQPIDVNKNTPAGPNELNLIWYVLLAVSGK
jgi:hypothetical protein